MGYWVYMVKLVEFIMASEGEQLDELGDCYWYTALLFHTTGLELLNVKKLKMV